MSSPAPTTRAERQTRAVHAWWSVGGVLCVAVAAGAWYALSLRPATHELDATWQAVERAYDYLSTENSLRDRLEAARAQRDQLAEQLAASEARLSTRSDETGFLSWFSEAAARCKLTVKDYRPAGAVAYGEYEGHALQLTGSGSYDAICLVLDDLRHCDQMNRVTNLVVAAEGADRSQLSYALRVELVTTADEVAARRVEHR